MKIVKVIGKKIKYTVADMLVGEIGYIVPWAADGDCVPDDTGVEQEEFGTANLKVKRVADGIEIDWDTYNKYERSLRSPFLSRLIPHR
jgi:hypothetical protein